MVNRAQLDALPMHMVETKAASRNDPILNKVIGYILEAWLAKQSRRVSAAIFEEAK